MAEMKLIGQNYEIASWKFHLPSDGQKSVIPPHQFFG